MLESAGKQSDSSLLPRPLCLSQPKRCVAGKDGTSNFSSSHPKDYLSRLQKYLLGSVRPRQCAPCVIVEEPSGRRCGSTARNLAKKS